MRYTLRPPERSPITVAGRPTSPPPVVVPGPLGERIEQIRGLLSRATRDDVLVRHEIGTLVADVKNAERTYGLGAVAQLAEGLGWDAATLYRYAAVAESWTAPELEGLLGDAAHAGTLVTWSHLVVISACEDASLRGDLVARVIRERLSVRAVLSAVRSKRAPLPPSHERSIARLKEMGRALLDDRKLWAKMLANGADARDETLVELLDSLVTIHKHIQATSSRSARLFERARDQLRRLPRGPSDGRRLLQPSQQAVTRSNDTLNSPRSLVRQDSS